MRQTNPNCGTTSDSPPGWAQQVRVTKQQLRLGHVQFARPKASEWRPGDSTEHKRGSQERSAHKYCTFTPTTSYLERMVQRPGCLDSNKTPVSPCPCQTVTATQSKLYFPDAHPLLITHFEHGFYQLCELPAIIPPKFLSQSNYCQFLQLATIDPWMNDKEYSGRKSKANYKFLPNLNPLLQTSKTTMLQK